MTLGDIATWTENWLEQTGYTPSAPSGNGHGGAPDGFEEYQVG